MTKKHKTPPLKADYRGATPRQVAEAVLRYRPNKKKPERVVQPPKKG